MLIGIDGNEANVEKRVGVNQYGYELLRSLYKLQGEWKSKYTIIVYLKNKPLSDMPTETNCFKYKVIGGQGLWIFKHLVSELWLTKIKPDIFFSPSHYVPPITPMPLICSIMDLGYLKFSGQFKKTDFWQLKLWSAYSILVSKSIIAISNSTKDDIVRHYPFASSKVYVTHLAYDRLKFNVNIPDNDVRRIKNRYSIVGDYILFLSTLKPSKNIEGLLLAFSRVKNKFPLVKLVIAGKKGWLYQSIFEKVTKLKLNNNVIFTDFVSEDDKPALMAGAKLFVLPSFWEGFGLDILNAMASGVPVVASNRGSIPEVVEEAGILIDPNDINSLAGGMEKVLSLNNIEYNKLVDKGLEQAKNFSWEKTARQTLEILEKTLRK